MSKAGEWLKEAYNEYCPLRFRLPNKHEARKFETKHYGLRKLLAERDFLPASGSLIDVFNAIYFNNYAFGLIFALANCSLRPPVDSDNETAFEAVGSEDLNVLSGCSWSAAWVEDHDVDHDAIENRNYKITHNNIVAHEDDVTYCRYQDAYYYPDDCTPVVTSIDRRGDVGDTEHCADDERERYAFFCDASDEWYDKNYFNADSYDPDGDGSADHTICVEYANARSEYMYSERVGCYVHEHDWDSSIHDYEDEDEEEDDDDGNRPKTSSYVVGYHKSGRARFTSHIATAKRSARFFFGYEIEMYFPDFDAREDFCRRVRDEDSTVGFETDGSLEDYARGVEAILPPVPLSELHSEDGVLRLVADAANEGEASVTAKCGVHITVNTHMLLRAHREQFLRAVYAMRRLSRFVAGREGNTYANYEKFGKDHYAAINERESDLYEVRIFAGTTDYADLVSYAEYLDAIRAWTAQPDAPYFNGKYDGAHEDALTTSQFRAFVRENRTTYPHLASRFGAAHKEAA